MTNLLPNLIVFIILMPSSPAVTKRLKQTCESYNFASIEAVKMNELSRGNWQSGLSFIDRNYRI